MSQIASIEYVEVQSEIEALLLESTLIKKHKPQYNIISKDDKSPYYIHITKETFPKPVINHDPKSPAAGPFLNSLTARRILKQFRAIAPYCIAPRPVKKPCFYSHLGLCDPCPGAIYTTPVSPPRLGGDERGGRHAYIANISRLKRLLGGQFSSVKSQLKKDMASYSQQLQYEKAGQIKSQLDALEHLLHIPVAPDEYLANPNLVQDKRQESLDQLSIALAPYIKLENLRRIELYDNAHLAGTAATAAMTVALDGEVSPKHYRHFTIRTTTEPDDVSMMAEVLSRRLKHTDWPTPDLIVLDGGKTQLTAYPDSSIPVIGLAKRFETLIIPHAGEYIEIQLDLKNSGLQLLQRLRDEAHRFSRKLHHKHRAKLITR